jgi:hypothetical protein
MKGETFRRARPVIAILGGGLSGAATAYHLARALPSGEAEIVVVEPRAMLGRGLAYSTEEATHRINVPAAKMSLIGDDLAHFERWLTQESIALSPGTLTLRGDYFPERRVFGQYVAAQLAPLLALGAVRRRRPRGEAGGGSLSGRSLRRKLLRRRSRRARDDPSGARGALGAARIVRVAAGRGRSL